MLCNICFRALMRYHQRDELSKSFPVVNSCFETDTVRTIHLTSGLITVGCIGLLLGLGPSQKEGDPKSRSGHPPQKKLQWNPRRGRWFHVLPESVPIVVSMSEDELHFVRAGQLYRMLLNMERHGGGDVPHGHVCMAYCAHLVQHNALYLTHRHSIY